jgi:phage-related protein
MPEYVVEFYRSSNGQNPIYEFVQSLTPSARSKTLRLLELARSKGPDLGMPYSRPLGHGLFELRVHDKQEVRLFYVFFAHKKLVILHAFQKKTQATPAKELKIARTRQAELT